MAVCWNRYDTRLQSGAYITDGKRLYEVLFFDEKDNMLTLQCCHSDTTRRIAWISVLTYRLVRKAPDILECLEKTNGK